MKTTMRIKISLLGCLLGLGCGLLKAETFLVEAGAPRAEIVIAEAPARMTTLAAQDLQATIQKISGATLPIVTEPTGKAARIYVGVSSHTEALGLSTNGLAHGAYRMASGPDWLALLGPDRDFKGQEPWPTTQDEWDALNPGDYYGFPPYGRLAGLNGLSVNLRDDGGTYNAVCDFLRELGVRWYFPGELGEIVPQQTNILLPAVNRTATPDFPFRDISYWSRERQWPEVMLWTLRQGGFAGQELQGTLQACHGLKWILMRDETKKAHPEWYALWNGKRATDHSYSGTPCLSSEGLFEQTLKFARFLFDARNEAVVNVDLPDGSGRPCQCSLCKEKVTLDRGWIGTMSEYVFGFANRVATELYKTNPDQKVTALSYSAYSLAPQHIEQFSPNFVPWINQQREQFTDPDVRAQALELRKEWLALLPSQEIYIMDHYLKMAPRYGFQGLPAYFPRVIAEDLRSLRGISSGEQIEVYMSFSEEEFGWHPLAVTHLNLYVTLRLLWDADQDIDAMLEEFYTLFYGPAAAPMKAFIEYSESNWPSMRLNVASVNRALELFATAKAAVDAESVYGQRIALLTIINDTLLARKEELLTYRQDPLIIRTSERAGTDLTIDGRLEEGFWAGLPSYELNDVATGEPVKTKTSFRVAWNAADRSLVFGIRCDESEMQGLIANATKNGDPALFNEDAIELFIETPFHAFYQIVVNSRGVVMDLDRKSGINSLWSSDAEIATFKGPDFWNLEIRIPSADEAEGGLDPLKQVNGAKPTAMAPWYFNVGRNRPRDKESELSSFSPTKGIRRFAVPAKFARLIVE